LSALNGTDPGDRPYGGHPIGADRPVAAAVVQAGVRALDGRRPLAFAVRLPQSGKAKRWLGGIENPGGEPHNLGKRVDPCGSAAARLPLRMLRSRVIAWHSTNTCASSATILPTSI